MPFQDLSAWIPRKRYTIIMKSILKLLELIEVDEDKYSQSLALVVAFISTETHNNGSLVYVRTENKRKRAPVSRRYYVIYIYIYIYLY
tara:strand:- start:56 stop:319 length:264 start_codon:yes stop_codon:yes gene_type:complete